jgi:hypothetical protein
VPQISFQAGLSFDKVPLPQTLFTSLSFSPIDLPFWGSFGFLAARLRSRRAVFSALACYSNKSLNLFVKK